MSDIYIPEGCLTLDKSVEEQIRLGIQGFPGTGKTWAALTFPNPIVINFDRGVGAHKGRADVVDVPFWNPEWIKTFYKNYKGLEHVKIALTEWLEKYGPKLVREQSLIIDGSSEVEAAYHAWYKENKVYSKKSNEENEYAEWNFKNDWFQDLHALFKSFKCNIIWLMHEAEIADKPKVNEPLYYSGKTRPLMSGQFKDKIVGKYTDWFRQRAETKFTEEKITDKVLKDFGYKDKKAFMERQSEFPRDTIYFWQTDGDSQTDGKCSSLVNFPKYIFADYKDFCKYKRQTTQS